MIAIAPMSSTMAKANKKSLSAVGTRLPSRDMMPSANAMSVATGIPQPALSGELVFRRK